MATKGVITWATCGPLITAILLVMSGSIVVAAPTCGQHEYLENGQCLPCPTCPPGYGVSGPCGFGRGALTTCIPCEPNPQDPLQTWPTFSDSTSQEGCQPCKLCDNSHYSVNCSADTNSHCGPCLFGFYRTHPDEENCLPCKHVIPPYAHLCKDWLDAQKTTMPTMTRPPTDVSTEPVTTTKKMVVTSDRDILAVSSEGNNSNGYDTTLIIIIAVLVGLGVFTFMAYKCGFLPCRKSTNPGPNVSTVDSALGSEDAAEHMDQHDTGDPEAGQQLDTARINLQAREKGGETDALLSAKTEKPNSITPGASGVDNEDRESSKDDSQSGNSSPSASSRSSLDTDNGAEGSTLSKSQGDANDCSDPSSGTELLKDQRRYKSHNKRASYGSHSQKSRLSSQLSPSSSSSEGSINGTVEGGASRSKQNNAIPCRAASQPTVVHWSGQGGTTEVLLQHQSASNQDVHKGSRPVVELHDGRLVNQTARPQSEPATERFKTLAEKMEMTEEIRKLLVTACDKFGDQGLEQLPEDARDKFSNYLDPQPDPEGAYCFWKHLADRFTVQRDKLQNLQGMRNLLQLLQTRNNCTIRELLQNVASIERFDALQAVCLSLLQDIEYSLQDTCISDSVI